MVLLLKAVFAVCVSCVLKWPESMSADKVLFCYEDKAASELVGLSQSQNVEKSIPVEDKKTVFLKSPRIKCLCNEDL